MSPAARLKPIPIIIDEIGRIALLIAEIAARLHAGSNVSAPMRRVLDQLVDSGPATVPTLARALKVTRQHVQITVNGLIDKSFVNSVVNPDHKRSKVIIATGLGAAALKEIRTREAPIGSRLAAEMSAEDAEVAASLLSKLRERLEGIASKRPVSHPTSTPRRGQ